MTFKELREQSGMTRKQFVEHFGIPYRTIQDWELGNRKCPEYLLRLMEYKLKASALIDLFEEEGKVSRDHNIRVYGDWLIDQIEEFKADLERGRDNR